MRGSPERRGGERVSVQRFETLLRRLLSIKGVVAPTVFNQVVPTLSIEDAGTPPEYAWLKGERRCIAYANQNAVAGQYSHVAFVPLVTRNLYVVERLWVWASALVSVKCWAGALPAGAAGIGTRSGIADTRWLPTDGTLAPYAGTGVVPTLTDRFVAFAVGGAAVPGTQIDLPLIINGGQGNIVLEVNGVNTTLNVGIMYRERDTEPSELPF